MNASSIQGDDLRVRGGARLAAIVPLREGMGFDSPVVGGEFALAQRPQRAARLRITRRGRIVLGVLIGALVLGGLAIVATLGATRALAASEAGAAEFGYVVVQPGDSLWGVATQLDGAADPRDLIAEIVRLNQLDGSGVQAGQAIAVPLRYVEVPGVLSAAEVGR